MKLSIVIAAAFFGLGFAHPASEAADFHMETRAELSELLARQTCCDFRCCTDGPAQCVRGCNCFLTNVFISNSVFNR
ncbi:hypothetical protein BKA66DRAFT_545170 [Pyrenochaeta sp. MPI-SDFR-AT-0127]|nr:hypothetical protein BKA66DRAFT_545170 [Pyrenochaeta sp. MPI-SDFR-AT-0127]